MTLLLYNLVRHIYNKLTFSKPYDYESNEIDTELEEQYFQCGQPKQDRYDYEELERASEAKEQEEQYDIDI
jgi:hypothetical protein